jgi:hypothetical protein
MAWHGNLVIRKVNVGGPAGDAFGFTVTKSPNAYEDVWSPAERGFTLTGAPSAAGPFTEGTSQKTYTSLWAGYDSGFDAWVDYRIREAARAGYRTTVGCAIAPDWNARLGGAIPSSYGAWTFTPQTEPDGTAVTTSVRWWDQRHTTTCTFTNTYRARLRLIKVFSGADAGARVDLSVNGQDVDPAAGGETFGHDDATGWIEVDGGTSAALAEREVAPTLLADHTTVLECRDGAGGQYGPWRTIANGPSGTLGALAAGRDHECRFTNTRIPRSGTESGGPITGTTPPGTTAIPVTPPGTPVTPSGTPVARASARVEGTTGCARAFAIVDVRGRGIAAVTFRINGRVAKRLDSANVAGMYRLRVRTRTLPRGIARVSADVRFRPQTGRAPARLPFRIARCPRVRNAPPTFTG